MSVVLWMPGAIRKEIVRHRRGPRPYSNRVNYHVAVSEAASLYGYFSGTRGIYSTFYVRKDGVIEQYVALDNYSGADYQGNDATVSVETQGGVHDAQGEPWTDAQVESLAAIAVFVHQQFPQVPLRLAVNSLIGETSKGLSWHRLGIDPWRVSGGMRYSTSRGKICPGNAKIAQMHQVLARAQALDGQPVSAPPPVQGNGGGAKNYLTVGDRGAEVRELQQLLVAHGAAKLKVDGVFGPKTLAAVRAFQMAAGLVIDGFAGPATMGALRADPPAHRVLGISGRNYLQRGDQGSPVVSLQRLLNAKGYRLVEDGIFGAATRAAVRAFQRAHGLKVDGVAGPLTQAALYGISAPKPVPARSTSTVLRRGSAGAAVKALQRRLNSHYPLYSDLLVDGLFGPATEAVVREFQSRAGLVVDGIVGPATRKALGL